MTIRLLALATLALWIVCGCSSSNPDSEPGINNVSGQDPGTNDDGQIRLFLKGDYTNSQLDDGLSGQTPVNYVVGIRRYQLLRAADDPNPQLCFDHKDKPAEAKLLLDNLVGFCSSNSIKRGSYTHGRITLSFIRFTVPGTLHRGDQRLDGAFTFFSAWSDGTYGGVPFKAGEAYAHFDGPIELPQIPYSFGQLPGGPGIQAGTVDGELQLTFAYERPLAVGDDKEIEQETRFVWQVHEGFRWKNAETGNHRANAWDVNSVATLSESVQRFGVNALRFESSD